MAMVSLRAFCSLIDEVEVPINLKLSTHVPYEMIFLILMPN